MLGEQLSGKVDMAQESAARTAIQKIKGLREKTFNALQRLA
tara:strand:- start:6690 stop:6812 length:123 start_codon:yes stop_codon:yes gene_type:complete